MKVLGKVWKDRVGLMLEFYIRRKSEKGWCKVNPIKLQRSNKRFNLLRLFNLFATRLEYPFSKFAEKRQGEKLMWERWIDVDEEVIVSLMNKKRKEKNLKQQLRVEVRALVTLVSFSERWERVSISFLFVLSYFIIKIKLITKAKTLYSLRIM